MSLTPNRLPASILVRACDELHPHPPHIHSLTQEHRNAKQERESTGECEKNGKQELGKAKEKSRNAGTQRSTGTHAHLTKIVLC